MARPARILACVLVVLAAPLTLAACGGSDDSTSGGIGGAAQAEIAHVIRTSVTSTDLADCTRLETQRFLEQIHFVAGPAALKACQEDAPDTSDDPDSVDIADTEISGTTATANVSFHGGGFDGSTLTMSLVKDGDQWKVDQIDAIPKFDLPAFSRSFTQRLSSQQGVPAAGTACVAKALDSAGPDVVKGALISGDTTQLLGLIRACLSGPA